MDGLHVIADDLTGACDVAAALLPWPGGITVYPDGLAAPPGSPAGRPLAVRNTQSRILPAAEAAQRVRAALAPVGRGFEGIVLKKIDTGLRGSLGAEIDAAMDALGAGQAFVVPAIPEVGRTTVGGKQRIEGVPVHRTAFAHDPHTPVRDSCVARVIAATARQPAGSLELEAVRRPGGIAQGSGALRARGIRVVVLDAETDGDLDAAVRALLEQPRPLLLVGSIGLARALRGGLRVEAPAPGAATSRGRDAGALVVLGSVHPAARAQRDHARRCGALAAVIAVPGMEAADAAGAEAARRIQAGDTVALAAPEAVVPGAEAALAGALRSAVVRALARARPAGLILVGGETAFHVFGGLGHPPLMIESRPAPLVVLGRLLAGEHRGLPVITKGGSSGEPGLLADLVRRHMAGRP